MQNKVLLKIRLLFLIIFLNNLGLAQLKFTNKDSSLVYSDKNSYLVLNKNNTYYYEENYHLTNRNSEGIWKFDKGFLLLTSTVQNFDSTDLIVTELSSTKNDSIRFKLFNSENYKVFYPFGCQICINSDSSQICYINSIKDYCSFSDTTPINSFFVYFNDIKTKVYYTKDQSASYEIIVCSPIKNKNDYIIMKDAKFKLTRKGHFHSTKRKGFTHKIKCLHQKQQFSSK